MFQRDIRTECQEQRSDIAGSFICEHGLPRTLLVIRISNAVFVEPDVQLLQSPEASNQRQSLEKVKKPLTAIGIGRLGKAYGAGVYGDLTDECT